MLFRSYYAFSECQTLKSVIIPSGNIFCDYFLENYEVVDIENDSRSMMSTSQGIFNYSPNLQPSIVEDGIAYLGNNKNKYVVAWKVSDTTKTSYTINDKCEYICDSCFDGAKTLTEITIPDSVIGIAPYAFAYLSNLKKVKIGNGVKFIGYEAFYYCPNLESVIFGNSLKILGGTVFDSCSKLISFNLPDSLVYVDTISTFGNYDKHITEIFIGAGMKEVSWLPENVSSINITISAANPYLIKDTNNKAIFAKSNGELSLSKYISTDTTYKIPATLNGLSVTKIGAWAFYNCSSLTSITIPNSVTSIGNNAVYNCRSLTSITIPDSVTSIGDYALSSCSNLSSVVIENGVTNIGENVFAWCSGLTSITIPDSVTTIGNGAFSGCSGLTSVVIKGNITEIPYYCFQSCSSLESIVLPATITSIEDGAFSGCSKLTTVYVDSASAETVTNLGFTKVDDTLYNENGIVDASGKYYKYSGAIA